MSTDPPSAPVRYTGKVITDGDDDPVVYAQASRVIDGGAPEHASRRQDFTLELFDGRAVEVRCEEAEPQVGPSTTLRGPWSEHETSRLGILFAAGPSPHSAVVLEGVCVRRGDPIEVDGEALANGAVRPQMMRRLELTLSEMPAFKPPAPEISPRSGQGLLMLGLVGLAISLIGLAVWFFLAG